MIAERLERQSEAFGSMGSPLVASIVAAAAADYREGGPVREFFDSDPAAGERSLIGLRFMGALHYCALSGAVPSLAAHLPSCGGDRDAAGAWAAAREFLAQRPPLFAQRFEVTPQTNETARAMPLLGGLLAIAARTGMPVRIFEVAASAGLNTRFDRYRYEGPGWSWGEPASPLVLNNRCKSGMPRHLGALLRIAERAACDLHPLDIASEADRMTLRSYVWADQLERLARLDHAIAAASALPLAVERADMFEWIPRNVAPREGAVTVVMQSVVMEHLGEDERERLRVAIAKACSTAWERARGAWLRMEGGGPHSYETRVTLWPGSEEIIVARSNGHAQDLEWIETF